MPWYSYLFFFFAVITLFGGTYQQAQVRNSAGVVYGLIVTAIWLTLGLWTAGVILS